jgi:AraC-like DNA-binding protein
MLLARWAAAARRMSTAEVHEGFDAHPDDVLLFSFRTDWMFVAEHTGGFSVKLVTHGRERYLIRGREVILSPGQVLLTNSGQSYGSEVDAGRTRAISWFLPDRLVPTLADPTGDTIAGWLERQPGRAPEVPAVPFRPSPSLVTALGRIAAQADALRPRLDLLEDAVLYASGLAITEAAGLVRADAFPARMRPATREELIARVMAARDLAESEGGRVSLARMADAAGLSRYHFLRVFHAVTGITPARYARDLRRAHGLARLQAGDSAGRAARAAGFASASTFLRSVRRR